MLGFNPLLSHFEELWYFCHPICQVLIWCNQHVYRQFIILDQILTVLSPHWSNIFACCVSELCAPQCIRVSGTRSWFWYVPHHGSPLECQIESFHCSILLSQIDVVGIILMGWSQHASLKIVPFFSSAMSISKSLSLIHTLIYCQTTHQSSLGWVTLLCSVHSLSYHVSKRDILNYVILFFHDRAYLMTLVATWSHPHTGWCLTRFSNMENVFCYIITSGASGIRLLLFHLGSSCSPHTSSLSMHTASFNCFGF